MKSVPVQEAREKLSQLIAEAYRGEVVLLTDEDKEVRLQPWALDGTRPASEKGAMGSHLNS
jgi:antitoxin (DNA-binding transcriptional repressor) of toxin-antitoxin stability system